MPANYKFCQRPPSLVKTPKINNICIEIELWLRENQCDNWIVIDDNISGITPYVSNVVKCRGWMGLTEEEYEEIKRILSK